MKKLIMAVITLCLMVCLVGCKETAESNKAEPEKESTSNIFIWIDEETGVQYIIYSDKQGYSGMGGITPRLNADGTLYTEEGK